MTNRNDTDVPMNVLVVEDETAATVNMLSILAKVCPSAHVMATLEAVSDTVEWLGSNPAPDVIFMDIHLADGSAFRIFDKTEVSSPVIFTTAYDHYALEAFKVNSIDYLLKPIKAEDLQKALHKLSHLSLAGAKIYSDRVAMMAARENNPDAQLLLRYRDRLIPVRGGDIAYAYSTDEVVTICTFAGHKLPYERSLTALCDALDVKTFFRANRQFMVSREAIADISVWFGGRLSINLRQPVPERIIVSKARTPLFKAWLQGRT